MQDTRTRGEEGGAGKGREIKGREEGEWGIKRGGKEGEEGGGRGRNGLIEEGDVMGWAKFFKCELSYSKVIKENKGREKFHCATLPFQH